MKTTRFRGKEVVVSQFRSFTRVWVGGLAVAVGFSLVRPAEAKTYTYTINQSQSQINLTAVGTALGGELTIAEQFPDSPTRYMGTLAVQYPGGVFPGGSISFPGGSAAAADVMRGSFNIPRAVSPGVGGGAGTAGANYGLTATADVNYPLPPIPYPDANNPIELGTLQSVQATVALRELVFDVDSASPMGLDATSHFDANGASVSLASGFADIKGALVLHQTNALTAIALYAVLQGLILAYPDYGLSVTLDLLHSNVSVGIGTRVDLSGIGSALSMPNDPNTLGLVAFNPVSQYSTLTLPIAIDLPDFGLPVSILDLNMHLDGKLVATATLPEPSTLAVFSLSALALVRRYRRRPGR
jgi:hypothetical protein